MTVIAIGYVIVSFIGFFVYAYYSGKFVKYSGVNQFVDLLPYALISVVVSILSYFLWSFMDNQLYFLIINIITIGIGYLGCSYIFKFKEFEDIGSIVQKRFKNKY